MKPVEGRTLYPFGNVRNPEALKDLWRDEGAKNAQIIHPSKNDNGDRKPHLHIVPKSEKHIESEE